jgi:hypothetical protein
MIKKTIYGFMVLGYVLLLMHCPSPNSGPPDPPTNKANWVRRIGGIQNDYGYAVMTTSLAVLGGQVSGDVDLNDNGYIELQTAESGADYGQTDGLVTVCNLGTGAQLWSKRLGSTNYDFIYNIAANNSIIAVAGVVDGNADLDGTSIAGDAGEYSGEIAGLGFGQTDAIVSVFDTSGNYQWSRRLGCNMYDSAIGVAIDGSSNVIVTGYISGDADLDGDLAVGEEDVTGEKPAGLQADNDIFIVSFSSTGTYNWSKRIGGAGSDIGNAITIDGSYIALAAKVTGDVDLNNDGDTSDNGESGSGYDKTDGVVIVYDSAGTYSWSTRIGGLYEDTTDSIVLDESHNVIAGGTINKGAFLHVYDSGGTIQWSKSIVGSGNNFGSDVVADSNGNIYFVGSTSGGADLSGDGMIDLSDPEESPNLSVYGATDAFITSFDSTGNHRWSERLGGLGDDRAYSIDIDTSGNVLVTGVVNGNVDLNGDEDFQDACETSTNTNDIFIVSLKQ